jgi:8-oxo-dGTP pyrophosphatase MutT (NUDIX family)
MESAARSSSIRPTAAVNAAIVDGQGRILVTRRSARVRSPGHWCLPGGHVEIGERWWDALVREVEEEVGLRVTEGRLVGIYADPAVTLAPAEGPGPRKQFVAAVFRVDRWEGEVRPNDEVDDFRWVSAEALPGPMLASHPPRVADALRNVPEVFVR